jgi:hypothetical protein
VTDTTISNSKTTGALKVAGGVGVQGALYGANANLEDVEADSVNVTDTTISNSKTTGALQVAGGVGVQGALYGANANLEDVEADSVNVTDTTISNSKTSGALQVAGGVGISGDIYAADATFDNLSVAAYTDITGIIGGAKVGYMGYSGWAGISHYDRASTGNYALLQNSNGQTLINCSTGEDIQFRENNVTKMTLSDGNLKVIGGTITNSGQVAKKTYSYSGALSSGQTIANSTIKITFSNHVFYAKVVAHLVDGSGENVSTLSFECGGGKWDGTIPSNNIAIGPLSIFGVLATNPWDPVLTKTSTTVAFKPTNNMAEAGHYNVFIEYISQSSSGVVTKITEGSTDQITYDY